MPGEATKGEKTGWEPREGAADISLEGVASSGVTFRPLDKLSQRRRLWEIDHEPRQPVAKFTQFPSVSLRLKRDYHEW